MSIKDVLAPPEDGLCSRPGCEEPLRKGAYYHNHTCAAKDKPRVRSLAAKKRATDVVELPAEIVELIRDRAGEDGPIVLEALADTLAPDEEGRTVGNWNIGFSLTMGEAEYRPDDALSFPRIEQMLRSGAVLFCLEMKLAHIIAPLMDEESWGVECPDKELAEVARANLRQILPRMAMDFGRAALAYGASFMEQRWERKTAYELGLARSRGPAKRFAVARLPNPVATDTIKHIERQPGNHKFNGFTQEDTIGGGADIRVRRNAALVITYGEEFRNLWGKSFLEAIYPLWFWYEAVLRAMVRFMQRMATPVVLGRAPSTRDVKVKGTTKTIPALDMILAVAANVAKANAVAVPSDRDPDNGNYLYELDYLASQDRSQPFLNVLTGIFQEMLRAAIVADKALAQTGEIGSYNLGQIHKDATAIHNEMILAQWVFALNAYFMPGYSLYSRGRGGPPIRLVVKTLNPQKLASLEKLVGIIGNSKDFQDVFWMIDWRKWATDVAFPLHNEAEVDRLKKKSLEEAKAKQEMFQAVQGQAGGQKAAEKKSAREESALEAYTGGVLALALEGDKALPLVLTEEEVRFIETGRRGNIKLFNPFHDKSGRFASGPGQGGGSSVRQAKERAISKAEKKPGSLVKTTGKVLGLGGLGLVGLMVVGSLSTTSGPGGKISIGDQKQAEDTIAELAKELEELTRGWPQPASREEAARLATDALRAVGVTVPADVNLVVQNLPSGKAGQYDAQTNTLTITEEMGDLLLEGDPVAMSVLAHELAHSAQELDPGEQGSEWRIEGFDKDANLHENFGAYLEAQNDLVTAIAISRLYGQPMPNDKALRESQKAGKIRQEKAAIEKFRDREDEGRGTRVTVISGGDAGGTSSIIEFGYQDQAEILAALVMAEAQASGRDAQSILAEQHDQGFDANYQHDLLLDLFPDEMEAGGYYSKKSPFPFFPAKEERRFPSMREVEAWMEQHGYQDPEAAYAQMLEEATR